jgi:hypothetical protein
MLQRVEFHVTKEELSDLFSVCKDHHQHRHLVVLNEISLDEASQQFLPVGSTLVIRCSSPAHTFDRHTTKHDAKEPDWQWFETRQFINVPTGTPKVDAVIHAPLVLRSTDFIAQNHGSTCPNLTSAALPRVIPTSLLSATPSAALYTSPRGVSPLMFDELVDVHRHYGPEFQRLPAPYPEQHLLEDKTACNIFRHPNVLTKNYCEHVRVIHNIQRPTTSIVEGKGDGVASEVLDVGADAIARTHELMRMKLCEMQNVIELGKTGMTFVIEAYGDAKKWAETAKHGTPSKPDPTTVNIRLGLTFHYTILTVPHI